MARWDCTSLSYCWRAETSPFSAPELKEPFLYAQDKSQLAPVMDFAWWTVRVGLARPRFTLNGGGTVVGGGIGQPLPHVTVGGTADLLGLQLTDAGWRWLESGDLHPLAPGFLRRLQERHPELPADVVSPIEDAIACLGFGLRRPSVVLLGLAYETAMLRVLEQLAARANLDMKRAGFAGSVRAKRRRPGHHRR